jgi:hypothetical protein
VQQIHRQSCSPVKTQPSIWIRGNRGDWKISCSSYGLQ